MPPLNQSDHPLPVVYLRVRSVLERIAVVLIAPVVIPLAGVIAIAIRLDSPGRALFRQLRPGLQSRPFQILKFRTMHIALCDDGRRAAQSSDARVTRLGRVLRAYHLDELPQLWNVLRGELSLIGPRPLPLLMDEEFRRSIPGFAERTRVLPGITGWAQVQQGYTQDAEEAQRKLELDLFYIKNLSFRLDVLILLITIRSLFRRNKVQCPPQ